MTLLIRDATEADLPSVLDIFNHAVRNTTAVFSDTEADLDGRRAWMLERQGKSYPVLVAVQGEAVLGFASFGDFRSFPGYRLSVEHSVYVDPAVHRSGVGRALMLALIDRARLLGKHVIIGGIDAGNAGSLAMHTALGFRETARMPQVAAKFGRWLDLVFMQLTLDDRPHP
jgi:phosphinothricin acetyltransferase